MRWPIFEDREQQQCRLPGFYLIGVLVGFHNCQNKADCFVRVTFDGPDGVNEPATLFVRMSYISQVSSSFGFALFDPILTLDPNAADAVGHIQGFIPRGARVKFPSGVWKMWASSATLPIARMKYVAELLCASRSCIMPFATTAAQDKHNQSMGPPCKQDVTLLEEHCPPNVTFLGAKICDDYICSTRRFGIDALVSRFRDFERCYIDRGGRLIHARTKKVGNDTHTST